MKPTLRYTVLCVLILLTASCGVKQASINVVSFNIRYNNPKDGPDAWPNRKEIVANMIQFYQADIVGTQEVLPDQLQDLQTLLPEYGWYGIGRDDGASAGEHMVIFYKKDRFEPFDKGTFWLAATPDTPTQGWDGACFRTVTWMQFKDKVTGKVFYHFNTHFDHRGVEARRESSKLLPAKITALAGNVPVVVTGDFNARTDSDVYAGLVGKLGGTPGDALTDARLATRVPHHGGTGTSNGGFKAIRPGSQIDYIFVKNGVTVERHGFLTDIIDGRFPSDHLPVLAEVVIP